MSQSQRNLVLRYLRQFTGAAQPGDVTDADLLARFVNGRDEAAFELLLWRHGALVLHVCRDIARDEHAAEDAFQATFLTLVSKAASIRVRESLSAWLHRVAYRVSLRARVAMANRIAREAPECELTDLPAQAEIPDEAVLRELRPLLHEEVLQLPTKYRLPVLLCYLEGLTHDEAARKLGWPKGTVAGRLARARELLRKRLLRRGISLSVALSALAMAPSVTGAALPAAVVQMTLRTALQVAMGQALASVVSPQVALLIEGVLQEMCWNKLRLLLALALALGLTGGGMALVAGNRPGEPIAQIRDSAAEDQNQKPDDRDAVRKNSRKTIHNLKVIGLAMHSYLDTYGCFPPAATFGGDNKPLLSWRVLLLPFLEQENLYRQFHLNEPWDSAHNKKLLAKMPDVYRISGNRELTSTFYQVFIGESTIFERRREAQFGGDAPGGAAGPGGGPPGGGQIGGGGPGSGAAGAPSGPGPGGGGPRSLAGWGISSITDGTSNTLLVVEGGAPVPWTKPEDLPYAQTGRVPSLGGAFKNAIHALFADGSVQGLRRNAPEDVLRAAITRDQGEVYDRDDLIDPAPGADPRRLIEENGELRQQLEKARTEVNQLHKRLFSQGLTKSANAKDEADSEELKREHQMLRRELERLEQEAARLRQQLEGPKPELKKGPTG